ncbi:hypothetical protein ACEPVM_16825 [Pseudomonas aeruginosa]|uniref:hypothetical protein n=1 Tax=Pseudomonas aeruginosa TaxID=287 RepID=UPI00053CF1E7|nr:hypothetical protein [Pseudomonas aeruginosa]KSL65873.1 hypothetical protein APA51_27845 [Pseudomonas aeruginosa]KSM82489.1 hypothetical protein APA72_31335 [Pseudomonas aeruginosa]MBX6577178.1 hypothetical protein [Pseudomonas aeruginosa]MBX6686943.1 hypothetical protein [Pseudomonas aeruginosa]MBX6832237.1 hypothetical protein [Pseudomonas aeruginosa]
MKRIMTFAAALTLGGCAAGPTWQATGTTDEFTDKTTMMVTTSDFPSSGSIVTRSLHFYPVVRKEGNEIYVGLMSGGRFKIPVGTVQMRIDQNEAWTITPQETPVGLVPAVPQYSMNLPPEQAAIVKSAQDQAMTNAAQMMSPYTVTGGDKAKKILKQMLSGRNLKYRTVGINQAASTTGETVIDPSLAESLRLIGIDPASL